MFLERVYDVLLKPFKHILKPDSLAERVVTGDQPEAKQVFDFDTIQLLRTTCMMRGERVFLSGRKINSVLSLFFLIVSNLFSLPYDWRPKRLAKKIVVGAQFI